MNIRTAFLPTSVEMRALSEISGQHLFISPNDSPRIGRAYIQQHSGGYLVIEWDYSDVEPRFEVFHVSFRSAAELPSSATQAVAIPAYQAVALATRFEWVRPIAGEGLGEHDKFIEEAGRSEEIPSSATAIARYVYGLLFINSSKPVFAVYVSENEMDSLALTSTNEELSRIVSRCNIEEITAE